MSSKHQDYDELSKKLNCVQHLLAKYERSAQHTIKKQEEVISLYKDIVGSSSLLGGLLSLTERKVINEEVKKVKTMFNLNMRTNKVIDLANVFDPFLFQNLVVRIKGGMSNNCEYSGAVGSLTKRLKKCYQDGGDEDESSSSSISMAD